jgi:beta-N-acetylhexosaminidase
MKGRRAALLLVVPAAFLLLMIRASAKMPDIAENAARAAKTSGGAAQPASPNANKWVDSTLRKMSVDEKIGQLLFTTYHGSLTPTDAAAYAQIMHDVVDLHVGGFINITQASPLGIIKSQAYPTAVLTNQLQAKAKLPLLIGADFERGAAMRLDEGTSFPTAMALAAGGNPQDAYTMGKITTLEARAVGIQWIYAPDADVNNNPGNPIINTRSFGEDPKQVGDLVAAYIKGAHEGGMLTTAKHFPGHGDTATDSHLGVASVNVDRAHLDSIELPPFRQAIGAGVDSVMVAHVTVPALDPDPNHVATISPLIVSDLLEKQLGFQGIVVTDALDMAGLTHLFANNIGRAAVEAFKAGNDLLLIPADFPASYNAMVQAVESGEISRDRLDRSVLKILKTKASLRLQKGRSVDLKAVANLVGAPENIAFGQQVADDAITLVRDNGKVLPLKSKGTPKTGLPYTTHEETHNQVVAVLFSDDVRTESGRAFAREFRTRIPDAHILYVDPRIAPGMSDEVLKAVDQAETVIAAVYVIPTAGKIGNTVAMADATGSLLQQLLDHRASRTAVVAMGNPYLAADFPKIENYMCTFSNASVSEIAAVKALFGEIPIRGHLPVSIPNVAVRGAGLERGVQSGGTQHAQE